MIKARPARALAVAVVLTAMGAAGQAKAQSSGPQGTGFYVRADLGVAFSTQADTRDDDCGSPNPFFGCGTSLDSSAGSSIAVGGGFGYRVNRWFRTDATVTWRPLFDVSGTVVRAGTPDRSFQADVSSVTGMLNGYLDIAGLLPPGKLDRFRPYVGAGLGVAVNDISSIGAVTPGGAPGTEMLPDGTHASPAWMFTAGTGIEAGYGFIVDLGYKYVDMGSFKSNAGQACAGAACRNIDAVTGDLQAHEFSAGLRFEF